MKALIVTLLILFGSCWSVPASTIHEVRKNDTLFGIARLYNVAVEDLIRVNRISDPNSLKVGDRILIPDFHVVEKGDTLFSISRRYGTTLAELLRLNGLADGAIIRPGDRIVVTDRTAPAPPFVDSTVPAVEASVAGVETPRSGSPAWPHPGERTVRAGKLPGTEILGKSGDPVYAVASGTVRWSGPYKGYGLVVIIEADDRHLFLYGGNGEVLVTVGDRVAAGAQIAKLATNPNTGEARVFFSVYHGGRSVDPELTPRG